MLCPLPSNCTYQLKSRSIRQLSCLSQKCHILLMLRLNSNCTSTWPKRSLLTLGASFNRFIICIMHHGRFHLVIHVYQRTFMIICSSQRWSTSFTRIFDRYIYLDVWWCGKCRYIHITMLSDLLNQYQHWRHYHLCSVIVVFVIVLVSFHLNLFTLSECMNMSYF